MRILHIEDDTFKHHSIKRVLEGCGKMEIVWVNNLEDGLAQIANEFDLIITDMWYPVKPGAPETESGSLLIQTAKEQQWNIPIILCSSVRYRIPEIYGTIYYSDKEDWESELRSMIQRIGK